MLLLNFIPFFKNGKQLGFNLKGKLGVEIRLTWLTGQLILKKIIANDYDVFQNRPVLKKMDFFKLLWIALSKKRFERYKDRKYWYNKLLTDP